MTIDAARITWTASALTTTWYRYLVQRLRPDAVDDWDTIAHIYTKATTTFDDYGARRGVAETYRVKQEDTNLLTSIASATTSVTVTGDRHYLVANHDTTLNVELALARGHAWTLGVAANTAVTDIAGGDTTVQWGDEVGDQVAVVAQLFSSTDLGPAQWDDLVAVMRAQKTGAIPHATWLDPYGNRREVAVIGRSASLTRSTRADVPLQLVDVGDPVPVEVP